MASERRPWRCTFTGDCRRDGVWEMFSAYPADNNATHPTVARYPVPQHALCAEHLAAAMGSDDAAPFGTDMWVIRKSKRGMAASAVPTEAKENNDDE